MSIPKFTAEASVENYGNAHASRKYKHEYGTSMRIEPQFIPTPGQCVEPYVCSTESCSYFCGWIGPTSTEFNHWCQGTRSKCTSYCCDEIEEGIIDCNEVTFLGPCVPDITNQTPFFPFPYNPIR